MSRYCFDCTLDGRCEKQKEGYASCSDGSEKSKEHRIKDIDNRVLDVVDILDSINKQYASWDLWDKTKVIDKAVNTLKEHYQKELIESLDVMEDEKSCLNCKNCYAEDIWNEFTCGIDRHICKIDIENNIYEVCDKWERDNV